MPSPVKSSWAKPAGSQSWTLRRDLPGPSNGIAPIPVGWSTCALAPIALSTNATTAIVRPRASMPFPKFTNELGHGLLTSARRVQGAPLASLENAATVGAPQSGDCHQFPPLELAGCPRFAHGRHLAEQSRPVFIPPRAGPPHHGPSSEERGA